MRLASKYNASVTLRIIENVEMIEFIVSPKDTIKKVAVTINWLNIISFDKENINLCKFDKMVYYLSSYIDKELSD